MEPAKSAFSIRRCRPLRGLKSFIFNFGSQGWRPRLYAVARFASFRITNQNLKRCSVTILCLQNFGGDHAFNHSSFLEKFMDFDRDDPDSNKLLNSLQVIQFLGSWLSSCPSKCTPRHFENYQSFKVIFRNFGGLPNE